jgi:hypothetical protein
MQSSVIAAMNETYTSTTRPSKPAALRPKITEQPPHRAPRFHALTWNPAHRNQAVVLRVNQTAYLFSLNHEVLQASLGHTGGRARRANMCRCLGNESCTTFPRTNLGVTFSLTPV